MIRVKINSIKHVFEQEERFIRDIIRDIPCVPTWQLLLYIFFIQDFW